MLALLVLVGVMQSWSVSLSIVNLCLISAIMALGVNMQWGYAGLFNVGIMGFAALGGLGLPIIFSWVAGGLLAAAGAWFIGRIALGLRSDYLEIATLGISEIVIAVLKNEDWLTRGVKNVTGLPRPVPYELNLQAAPWLIGWVEKFNQAALDAMPGEDRAAALRSLVIDSSGIFVKLCYAGLFLAVLVLVLWLSERALRSPWGRMMRAIRGNEEAAEAMGKDVKRRHLEIFVIGSAVVGIAGAMLTTLDGQFTPGTYNPLRYTFLIWVMVIVGGSGNNFGSELSAFLIWFVWVEAEPVGLWLMQVFTDGFGISGNVRSNLMDSAPHMRLILMGLLLLLALRFSPRGLIPEVVRR